jgi:Ser-tRNA(Ala) deacylase AlaX
LDEADTVVWSPIPGSRRSEDSRVTTADHSRRPATFHAVVIDLRGGGVVLGDTMFHPATVEREADRGLVHGWPVVDVVRSAGGSIVHRLRPSGATGRLRIGDRVEAEVDLAIRWTLSRLDSAAHLIAFGYEATHGPAIQVERRITASGAHVRVVPSSRTPIRTAALGEWVERAIADDLLISVLEGRLTGGRRRWHVDGIGSRPCEGLHPTSTGQVGRLEIEIRADDGSVSIAVQLAPEGRDTW